MARFGVYAHCAPVCGNLFHHAVEMLLKGAIAPKREPAELKEIGHNLKALWRKFKADFPDPNPNRHDRTISVLDKLEDIRYPDAIKAHSIGWTAQWSGPAGTVTTYGRMKTPKEYAIVVDDIDDLVADVFKISSWNASSFMGTNRDALEAITRRNKHAGFLTRAI